MARPGFTQHRKFRRLTRTLKSAPLARGVLEMIWDVCYENGDDYLGQVEDVAAAAQFDGDPDALLRGLLDAGGDGNCGFLEEVQDRPGHFRVHDLYDHAPEYVRRRMARELARVSGNQDLRSIRAEAGRRGGIARAANAGNRQANDGHLPDGDWSVSGKWLANVATPAPAPAPAPAPIKSVSSEPQKAAASEPAPAFYAFPCVKKGRDPLEYRVTGEQIGIWRETYEAVDIVAELKRMHAWLAANPTKRKTFRGYPAFLVKWLSKVQDDGGSRTGRGAADSRLQGTKSPPHRAAGDQRYAEALEARRAKKLEEQRNAGTNHEAVGDANEDVFRVQEDIRWASGALHRDVS